MLQQMDREVVLEVENVNKSYPLPGKKLNVLHDLTFTVKRGEFVAISGPSGTGKTTLLALLGALDQPDTGEIWLDNVAVHTLRGRAAARFRRQKVGFVFQLFYLLPNLTALENVMAPLLPFHNELDFELRERAMTLLERVGLSQRLDHLPGRLSGGEQQRVAIARALINRPSVLLADEPSGNLDPATGSEILSVLRTQQVAEHQTLIMVTHDASIAASAERRIRLRAAAQGLEIEGVDVIGETPLGIYVPNMQDAAVSRRRHGISRRAILAGLGVATLAVAGGITWFKLQPSSSSVSKEILAVYRGQNDIINAVTWSQDNTYIASACAPFNLQQWRNSSVQQHQEAFANIQADHLDASVQTWVPLTEHRLMVYRGHKGGATVVRTSPDGQRIASGGLYDGTVQLWNPYTGQHILTHNQDASSKKSTSLAKASSNNDGSIWTIAWSPTGKRIASGDENGRVQVWDAQTGQIFLMYDKHTGPINALAWSPDGTQIASASDDNTVQVWDTASGKQNLLYTHHSEDVRTVLWSVDGQNIISGGADHTIWAWDATSGNPIWVYEGHTGPINALVWSPDNSKLLSASGDRTVRVWADWQSGSGKLIHTYKGHTGEVLTVAWAGDGTKFASGSSDKTVYIWAVSP